MKQLELWDRKGWLRPPEARKYLIHMLKMLRGEV